MVDRAQDVVHLASCDKLLSRSEPVADRADVGLRELAVAMGTDLAVPDVGHGNLLEFDPAVAVFGVHPEHGRAVLADAEVVVGEIAGH